MGYVTNPCNFICVFNGYLHLMLGELPVIVEVHFLKGLM